jgi:hypothetical protein
MKPETSEKLPWTSDVREIERRMFGNNTLIWDKKDLNKKLKKKRKK